MTPLVYLESLGTRNSKCVVYCRDERINPRVPIKAVHLPIKMQNFRIFVNVQGAVNRRPTMVTRPALSQIFRLTSPPLLLVGLVVVPYTFGDGESGGRDH